MKKLLPLLLAGVATQAFGAHYDVKSETTKEARRTLIQDLRYPVWTNGHYLACFSQRFKTQEGWGGYFYGGIVGHPADKRTLIQICSWQMSGKAAPANGIDFIQAGKNMSWAKSTWEGSAGGIKGQWPADELRNNTWYRFVATTWPGPGEKPDHSFIGVWMKDTGTGEWYHLGTTRYPGVITDLSDHFGFQENFAGQRADAIATVDIRNTYSRRNGAWVADNKVQLRPQRAERVKITPIDGGSALKLQTSWDETRSAAAGGKGDAGFLNEKRDAVYRQPATPDFFDAVATEGLSAARLGPQLYVKWKVPAKASPQLGYKIEVFDNAGFAGTPAVVALADEPDTRDALLDIGGLKTPYVRLTITDIFANTGKPATCAAGEAAPSPAQGNPLEGGAPSAHDDGMKSSETGGTPGLRYAYYEAPMGVSWKSLPDFTKLKPVRSGVVGEPDLTPRLKRTNYAFRYEGDIVVAKKGIHQFTLTSACGAKLVVDGRPVVDFDGYHSIGKASGAVPLEAGAHRFELNYFQGERQTQQADDFLQLAWQAPGATGGPVRVPVAAFKHPEKSARPAIVVEAPPAGALSGATEIPLGVRRPEGVSSEPERIQYFMTNPGFDYFAGQGAKGTYYFLGETTDPSGKISVPVWGPSEKTLHARLIFKDGGTLDSAPVTFTTTPGDLGAWKLTELEHHQYPVAAKVEGDSVSLVGESMALLTRPVTGDCEITAHLADITPNVPGPDGTRPDAGVWQAGIILRHDLGASPGEPLGGNTQYTALLGKVNGDVAYCDSLMKNGAGNQPSGNQGSKNRWFRITRRGATFTNSVSPDGVTWKVVKTVELPKMGGTAHAGFFLYALPSAATTLHHARFDHILVTSGTAVPAK